jgi:uncharacterized Zn finger protein
MAYDGFGWRPYVPVSVRRQQAQRELERLARKKKGYTPSPVRVEGRRIAATFWGRSWCENLERYSDYANRLPRGRTYVRNGSVVDLQITRGQVEARVSGSSLYTVAVSVAVVATARWASIRKDCAGSIDSLVELLQGRFSKGVMERLCREKGGLFPRPDEIEMACSCPDWAAMCKHIAAVLYGIGARLDERPELLFLLRGVEAQDLIAKVGQDLPFSARVPDPKKVLPSQGLSELFGIDLATAPARKAGKKAARSRSRRRGRQ